MSWRRASATAAVLLAVGVLPGGASAVTLVPPKPNVFFGVSDRGSTQEFNEFTELLGGKHPAVFSPTETIEEEEGVSEAVKVLASPTFPRSKVLGEVPDDGSRYINALPILQPESPTQINVFAVHEKKLGVETANLIERSSPNQSRSA